MESSIVFVQHQPFQFHQESWSDVEKNTRRCRWRKSHRKIKVDYEFGLTIQREGSKRASSSNYSEWYIDDKWSSQEWKSGEMLGARTERPVVDKFVIDDDVDSNTATESNLSLWSRSLLNRVNDRLRKILDHSSEDAMQDIDTRSMIWRMFMSSTLEASVFMEKNYSDNLHSIKNTGWNLTLKQLFDISEKLIVEQSDEIFGVSQISWENYQWKQFISGQWWRSHQSLACKVLCILRFCVMSWKGESETNIKILFGKKSWVGSKIHHNTELWTQFTENWWNSSGIFSQDSLHCSSSTKSKSSWTKWATQRNSKGELSSCRCSMTSYGEFKTMNRNVLLMPHLCLYLQKRFPAGRWSFLGPGSEKKWCSTYDSRPRREWDRVAELMMINFRESEHPVFRVTSPFSRGTLKGKGGGKWSIDFCADGENIETVFRTIISVNQLNIYGAVSDVCEEYKACQAEETRAGRTIWPIGLYQQVCWRKHLHFQPMILRKKIYCKSTKNEWKGFHKKIGWWRCVLTQDSWKQLESDSTSWQRTLKSSHNLQNQWHVVSTLCQEMTAHLTRKDGFEWTPKLDPCWKSQPVTCKVKMEWKLELNP